MNVQTINISLPKELVSEVDRFARIFYKNRSELIRDALVAYIQKNQKWQRIFEAGRKAGKKASITSEQQVYDIMYEIRHGKKASPGSNRQ
jgi:metal-responsive CopG/Arc/MetJ family transcriptional regulator